MDAIHWHGAIACDFEAAYTRSPRFKERLAVWSELIQRYSKIGGRVLDVGCGPGLLASIAADRAAAVLAFDASLEMVGLAQARVRSAGRHNVRVLQGFIGDPQLLGDQRFDLVVCSSVLEYINQLGAGLDWLVGALDPGGVLLVSLPNGGSLYRKVEGVIHRWIGRPAYYRHVRHVPTSERAGADLVVRGLRVEETRYYSPAPLLSRLARAAGRPELADTMFVLAARRVDEAVR